MAALDFPASPVAGQVYEGDNGVIYTYVGTAPNGHWSAFSELSSESFADIFVEVAGDNMTGSLTLGTDKITLDAGDGSITAAGNIDCGNQIRLDPTERGISLTPGGELFLSRPNTSGLIYGYRTGEAGVKFQLNNDGNITAAGNIQSGGNPVSSSVDAGVLLRNTGLVSVARESGRNIFTGFTTGNATQTIQITSDGGVKIGGTLPSAPNITLASDGSITAAGAVQGGTAGSGGTDLGIVAFADSSTTDGSGQLGAVYAQNSTAGGRNFSGASSTDGANVTCEILENGSASFSGQVTATGGIEFGDGTIQLTAASGSGGVDLQSVTDEGNTTTNGATFGGNTKVGTFDVSSDTATGFLFVPDGLQYVQRPALSPNEAVYSAYKGQNKTINLTCGGDASFTGNVQSGGASYGNENGLVIEKNGGIRATNDTGSYHLFRGYTRDNPANTASITAEGLGQFKKIQLPADVTIPRIALDGSDGTATFSPGTGDFVIGEDGFIRSSRLGQYCWMNADINSIGAVAFGTAPVNDAANPSFYVKLDGSAVFTGPVNIGGTADANEISEYEEGTWTPSVGGNATYTYQGGSYTKIGRVVIAKFEISITTLGTGSTQRIENLPFGVTGANGELPGAVNLFLNLAFSAASVLPYATAATTRLHFNTVTAGGSYDTNINTAIFQDGARIAGSVTYFTD